MDPAVARLAGAFPLVPRRWVGHGVERVKEARLPSLDDAYCDVGWGGGDDVWEAEQTAGIAAVDTAEENIPGQGVRVRRFLLPVRKD